MPKDTFLQFQIHLSNLDVYLMIGVSGCSTPLIKTQVLLNMGVRFLTLNKKMETVH